MDLFLWLVLVVVVLIATRARRLLTRAPKSAISDSMVRRIEREGTLRVEEEEPLDRDRIRSEEDAFWSETWDEPEEL